MVDGSYMGKRCCYYYMAAAVFAATFVAVAVVVLDDFVLSSIETSVMRNHLLSASYTIFQKHE
jgi:hypothetical protein